MSVRALAVLCLLLASPAGLAADEVVVRSGKSYRGFARREGAEILLNEYGSSAPEMTVGVRRLRAIDVRETKPWPLEDHLQRELEDLGAADVPRRVDLMRAAQSGRLADWARRLAAEILVVQPTHAEALKAFGGAEKFAAARRGNLALDPMLAREVRGLLRIESGADRRADAERLTREYGYAGGADAIERMVRSQRVDRGLKDEVLLRLEASDHVGGRYALYIPPDLDPVEPLPVLFALHGGGIMHAEKGEMRGSPKDALALYLDDAKRLGWILVCPQALEAPWGTSDNYAFLEAVYEEVTALWNVDLERVHLVGQGGGADGAWYWAGRKADRFASVSIAAGGKPEGYAAVAGKTNLWLYHGDADEVVPIEPVRKAAESLLGRSDSFVYCELPREGHGLAPAARRDLFRSIAPKRRRRADSAWPRASFAEPSGRAALAAFGDPAAAWGIGFPDDLDGDGLLQRLTAGRSDAEHAARRMAQLGTSERARLSAGVRAVVRAQEHPAPARVWAAWLCGRWRDPAAISELGDVLRTSKDTRLLRHAAEAVGQIGLEDSTQDLRWALADVSTRYRSLPGQSVPFQEFERTCKLGGAVARALGQCAKGSGELFGEIEENLVRHVLMDRRPIAAAIMNGEDASVPRAALVGDLARAYRALHAESTLFDMLRAAVRGDKRAEQALDAALRAR